MKKKITIPELIGSIKEQAAACLKGHKETVPVNAAYAVFFCICSYMPSVSCVHSFS